MTEQPRNQEVDALQGFISPQVEGMSLPITEDASRGDGRVRQVPYSFASRVVALMEMRGLGDLMTIRHDKTPKAKPGDPDQGADYFMTEATLRGPGIRRLGVVTKFNTFSQCGSGETVVHEGMHRKVAELLGPEILDVVGKEVDEALAFAMEVVIFGNKEDVYKIVSQREIYDTREAYLTAHFLRVYYMSGTVKLLELVKRYAEVLKKHPNYKLDDLVLLADKDKETSPEAVRVALGGEKKRRRLWASLLADPEPVAADEEKLILDFFTKSFGISEESAKRLVKKQGYKTLEDAMSDLSDVKVSTINAENRLNSMFYLATKQTFDEVRARTAKIVELDLQADVVGHMAGMNNVIAKLHEVFGQDAVAEIMGIAITSPLLAEQLTENLLLVLDLCGHDRETALMFSEKFSKDVHFRHFLLNGGLHYLQSLYRELYGGYREEGKTENAKVHLLRSLLEYRYDWYPKRMNDRPGFGFNSESHEHLRSNIVGAGVPIEIHTQVLALIPRLHAIMVLAALPINSAAPWLKTKKGLTFVSDEPNYLDCVTISAIDILNRIIDEAKREFVATGSKDYTEYCQSLAKAISTKVDQLESGFKEALDLLASGKQDELKVAAPANEA